MYCPSCGAENEDAGRFCSECARQLPDPGSEPDRRPGGTRPGDVPNYLVQAILVTIFCCLPFGIVAIVYAAQVNGRLEAGDYEGALRASRRAKLWSNISFGVVLVLVIVAVFVPLITRFTTG